MIKVHTQINKNSSLLTRLVHYKMPNCLKMKKGDRLLVSSEFGQKHFSKFGPSPVQLTTLQQTAQVKKVLPSAQTTTMIRLRIL